MRIFVRWASAVLAVVGCLLTAPDARADAAAQARFHDEQARAHYEHGRYEDAIREFYESLQLAPNPRITFNIALCFEQLKRPADAFMLFREYLDSDDPSAERQTYAQAAAEKLVPKIARFEIKSDPPGARIYVDRRELGDYGRTPRVIALQPGEHKVWVELEGYRPAESKAEAALGGLATVQLAPQQILGGLLVDSPVEGRAEIRTAEGKVVSEGSTPLQAKIPPGPYEITVHASAYSPWRGLAAVEADHDVTLKASPTPLPKPTAEVTVTSNISGAVVTVDGKPAAFAPSVLSGLSVGRHEFLVESPDRLPWQGPVELRASERTWITVSLEEPADTSRSPATWVVGGLGALSLVSSIVVGGVALSTHSEFESAVNDPNRGALRDRGQALNTAADVLLVTGVAGLAVGTILFFATEGESGTPSEASVTRGER
jgi:outer membrane receptor for ferrienterochelin and colicins